jgi:hypothetical protein
VKVSESSSQRRPSTRAARRPAQSKQFYHRYRLSPQGSTEGTSKANIGRKRNDVDERTAEQLAAFMKAPLPLFKGNHDPFNSSVIPVSALDHSLIQAARAQSMKNTWPSEIVLRKNHTSITAASFQRMPFFIANSSVSHALLAHAYFSSSARQKISGQDATDSLSIAEHHKFKALRSMQLSIQKQQKNQDSFTLWRIWEACNWLAAAEMLSGNIQAAVVHMMASRKIVDQLGGWSKM